MPRFQLSAAPGEELRDGVEVVDVNDAARHGDDDLGWTGGYGVWLGGERNADWSAGGGEIV